MKSKHQQRVEEFMLKAGQNVPDKPQWNLDSNTRKLRAALILEEALETIEALGFTVFDNAGVNIREVYNLAETHKFDLVKAVDGCADISVVNIGTLSAMGIKDIPVLEEVDSNNLSKFGPGGYRREDGKWMKPPNFVPANFKKVIEEQENV